MTGGQTGGAERPLAVVERDGAPRLWFLRTHVLMALSAAKEVDQRSHRRSHVAAEVRREALTRRQISSCYEVLSKRVVKRLASAVMESTEYSVLAGVRHSLRALNGVIEAGAKAARLTVQQQAFLLSLAAHGGTHVPLADLRADLGMDQATTSELMGRLGRRALVTRRRGIDRRAVDVSLTRSGRSALTRSVRAISREMKVANARGDLDALHGSLRAYLAFHTKDL